MLKSGMLLVGGGFASKLLNLVRTAILARLLTVEDYGVVATFGLTLSLMEMLASLSLDRLVVQDRNGDDPKFVATIHTLQLIRGAVTGTFLFLLAEPYARLMGAGDILWPYQMLALMPIITGLINLDIHRQQRHGGFWAFTTWMFSLDLVALMLVGALWLQFDDWQLGLWSIFGGHVAACIVSHLVSKRRYAMAFDREVAVRAFHFGWPLLVNAALLFLILNGDRVIVSNQMGLVVLAGFAQAAALTLIPNSILVRAHQYICMPVLTKHQDDPEQFERAVVMAMQTALALGLALALGFALAGPDLMRLIFGAKYAGLGTLVILLGLYQGVRLLREGTSVITLAKAETQHHYRTNLVRALGVPVGFWAVTQGASLEMLVAIGTLFEALAFVFSLYLLQRLIGWMPREVYAAIGVSFAVMGVMLLDVLWFPPSAALFDSWHAFQIVLILVSFLAMLSMSGLREWAYSKLRRGGRPA